MTSNRPYLIRAIHEWICDNGLTTHLAVDAGYPGVEVPQEFVQDGQIVLNMAPRAVTGLHSDNDEIAFSARFGGVPRQIRVPINAVMAVFARENGQGMAFDPVEPPVSPPPSKAPSKASSKTSSKKGNDKSSAGRGSHLKVIK